MDLRSLSKRDDSRLGAVVGLAFVAVALLGSQFLDWEWPASINQPVPLAIGGLAAVVAAFVAYRRYSE